MSDITSHDSLGPEPAFERLRQEKGLTSDPLQMQVARRLQELHEQLDIYTTNSAEGGFRSWFKFNKTLPPPLGLYIHGDVGRGKSMLMDVFYQGAPVKARRRVHFHAFMLEIHARIHMWRQLSGAARAAAGMAGDDPIPPLARRIADELCLLCFDEFQVTDVADAMILARLFENLFDHGVVVVLTSNQAPDELYQDGLNRQLFLPFIELLKERLDILHLDGSTDYRLGRLAGRPVYFTPADTHAQRALDRLFCEVSGVRRGVPEQIELGGRVLDIPEAAHGVARFNFDDLCAKPLGAADYLALASRYHTLVISDIPQMPAAKRNEARRFSILIDTLYEQGRMLICSAQTPPEALYPDGDGHQAFTRTVSRLVEMQARDYLEQAFEHQVKLA